MAFGASDSPRLLIVAGPNGSGKSSLYQNTDIEDVGSSVWIINPDLLSARIRDVEGLPLVAANIEAVRRIMNWLEASIRAHQTIGVETVLSTPKYRRLVTAAKKLLFEIDLIYVMLESAELNIQRVKTRVAKGGHDVPTNKIIERRERSLKQLPWFLRQADRAWLYDNSGAKPRLMGAKSSGIIRLDKSPLPEIKKIVEAMRTS